MTASDFAAPNLPTRPWQSQLKRPDQQVETLPLRGGATLILSQFAPGSAQSFSFTEPEDVFGFGFHLRDGAQFKVESTSFQTSSLDVWSCASPRGSESHFVLPPAGFRTVAVRFTPSVADEYFDGGNALPDSARQLLQRARETAGVARLMAMKPASAARLESMFNSGYGGAARRLYLESCTLDLLAGQISDAALLTQRSNNDEKVRPRHREIVMAARDYLDRHYREPPTITELARILGTNEFTLKREFKRVFGTTLFAHVSLRRMERAEWLLRQGLTVAAVANEIGYECVRSFSAAFRRHTGRPPSAVRRDFR